jgi:hypothetical protein
MIREGSPDVTLGYLARHRTMLAISSFSDGRFLWKCLRMPSRTLSQGRQLYGDPANIAWLSPNPGAKYPALYKLFE